MTKRRGDALAMADAALREVDEALRGAGQVRLRAAVDRLMDSAAPSCTDVTHHGEGWAPEGVGYDEWLGSVDTSTTGAYRLCGGDCWDSVEGLYLDCSLEGHVPRDDMGLWCLTPWVPPANYHNHDVLSDPPDGIGRSRHTSPHVSVEQLAARWRERLEAQTAQWEELGMRVEAPAWALGQPGSPP